MTVTEPVRRDVLSAAPGEPTSASTRPGGAGATAATLDAFMCVHSRDLDYLFELALRSYLANFRPRGRLFLVTNDTDALNRRLERAGLGDGILVSDDAAWLSSREQELPGWYRQQVIKLRSHLVCGTASFCNLGADTLLLREIERSDLVGDAKPYLYYNGFSWDGIRRLDLFDQAVRIDTWLYEKRRLRNVARILQVRPTRAGRYVDFIFDLFCFDRAYLEGLNGYLARLYGPDYFSRLLSTLGDRDRTRFGEWTLYATYLLDVLKAPVAVRDSASSFLAQVRSRRVLDRFTFDSKIVHFVDKSFGVDAIVREIVERDLPLARHLVGNRPPGRPGREASARAVSA
jgi:hypothetical protein